MGDTRRAIAVCLLALAGTGTLWVWVVALSVPATDVLGPASRPAALGLLLLAGAWVLYEFKVRDRAPDRLAQVAPGHYFERDGLSFHPVMRVHRSGGVARAEVSVYFQNRYEGECEAVVHLRPPERTLASHRGGRDVHIALRVGGGAFGVVHQPVAVAPDAQGMPVEVELAAAVRWLRGKGERMRSRAGREVGTFEVDWALAYRQSRHELCGEIELKSPATHRLTMPERVADDIDRGEFKIEWIDEPLAGRTA